MTGCRFRCCQVDTATAITSHFVYYVKNVKREYCRFIMLLLLILIAVMGRANRFT